MKESRENLNKETVDNITKLTLQENNCYGWSKKEKGRKVITMISVLKEKGSFVMKKKENLMIVVFYSIVMELNDLLYSCDGMEVYYILQMKIMN